MAAEEYEQLWLRRTTNELNNHLQIMVEIGEVLASLDAGNPDAKHYLEIFRESAKRAAAATREISQRSGGAGDPGSAQAPQPAAPAPTPPPTPTPTPAPTPATRSAFTDGREAANRPAYEIRNPNGALELVLVVDDEESISLLASRSLAKAGYRVITAKDGLEALEIYRQLGNKIDLVLLDFTMPVLNGEDVFDELRSLNPRVNVVLSSGFAEQSVLQRMLARGLRGFIPKPYMQERLPGHVRQTLDAVRK